MLSNFGKLALLANEPISINLEEEKQITLIIPNIRQYYLDLKFQTFLGLIRASVDDINNQAFVQLGFKFETNYDLICGALKYGLYDDLIEYGVSIILPDCTIGKDSLLTKDGRIITNEDFEIIKKFLQMGCLEIPFEEKEVEEIPKDETPLQKRLRETEEKLNKTKRKKKKKDEKKSGNVITFDQIVIALMYELPSLTIDRIFDMNVFTLLEFWGYVHKFTDNKIQLVAAGNGLIKEFTYFIK